MNLPIAHTPVGDRITPLIILAKAKLSRKLLKFKDSVMGQVQATRTRAASPAKYAQTELSNKLALGAGCYWGTEKYVRKNFQDKFPNSIKSCQVGFMSPEAKPRIRNPDYRQVCSGASGHVEVLQVELHEPEKHFEELIRFFFMFHDPTTQNQQGNDRGFQYASWIFCGDDAQSKIATKVRDELQTAIQNRSVVCFANPTVTTKIAPLREFTVAQADHQEILGKEPERLL
jgi:peptide-methionine (S)-S-oxide reductase